MNKLIILVLFSLCTFSVAAQYQLSGTITDGSNSPVPFATAALLRSDSTAITGVMAGDDGKFVIENVAAGEYILQVSFIGYNRVHQQVNVPAQSDVGVIRIIETTASLQEIVVTAQRPLIDHRIDRIVVNIAGNMITAGLNINDLLKQMPGLVVDQDGNVRLNGRSATVYINGRPTRLPQEQIAMMLNGMMGDVVDRVELIDNPSSRYEAGMSAAIVNIRLKRDMSLGLNGSAQASAGTTDHNFASRGGLNLNYRSKQLNIFGNYGYNDVPFYSDLWQLRNYDGEIPITYDQHTLIEMKSPSHTLRTGIDWFVAPKHTVGLLFIGTYNENKGNMISTADVMQNGEIVSYVFANTKPVSKFNSQMYNLNYRFDGEKNGVLSADLDIGHVYSYSTQNIQSRYRNVDGSAPPPPIEFQNSGPRDIEIFSIKLDYEKQLSERSKFETGLKTGQTVTDNNILYEIVHEALEEEDNFKYTEQVSAAYLTYSHRFGKFAAMAGVRAEYTFIEGVPTNNDTFSDDYFRLFPSAYMHYQINDKQGLNLSYSRKINRPGFSLLNPFRIYADPFTFQSGNSYLDPAYINTFALRYNISNYSANLSYSVTNDIFEQDYVQNNENHTLGLIPNNIGKREQLTLSVSVPLQIATWYNVFLNSETFYIMADTRHNGEQFLNEYFRAFIFMTNNFTILPTLRANVQMWWSSSSWQGIFEQKERWSTSAQISKTLFSNRLTLSLSCNDIFNSVVSRGKMKFGNIDQNIRQETNQRHILFTVRYSFGSQQIRTARNRNVGIEEEMGRTR